MGSEHHAVEVDPDHAPVAGGVEVLSDPTAAQNPGIQVDEVEVAVELKCGVDSREVVFEIRDVAADEIAADARRHLTPAGLVNVGDDDARARFGQRQARGATDAASAPGDERHLPIQAAHGVSSVECGCVGRDYLMGRGSQRASGDAVSARRDEAVCVTRRGPRACCGPGALWSPASCCGPAAFVVRRRVMVRPPLWSAGVLWSAVVLWSGRLVVRRRPDFLEPLLPGVWLRGNLVE